jgi:hypothetical protein
MSAVGPLSLSCKRSVWISASVKNVSRSVPLLGRLPREGSLRCYVGELVSRWVTYSVGCAPPQPQAARAILAATARL